MDSTTSTHPSNQEHILGPEAFSAAAKAKLRTVRYNHASLVLAIRPAQADSKAFDVVYRAMRSVKNAQVVGGLKQDFLLVFLCEPVCSGLNRIRAVHVSIRHLFSEVKHHDERLYRYMTSGKIGVSVLGVDSNNVEKAIRRACQATLAQGAGHASRVQFYDSDLQLNIKRYVLLEELVRDAIDNGETRVQYQPIVRCHDWSIAGYEALCRFNIEPSLNASTAELIGLAEDLGLISDLDLTTYQQAFQTCASLLGKSGRFLNINLSPNTQQNLAEVLQCMRVLAQNANVSPEQIVVDINEVKNPNVTLDVETILPDSQQIDINFALDDLSSGFDLAEVLRSGRFRYLRLSRAMIERSHKQGDYYQVIKLLVRLCHRFEVQVIAEGVETIDEARLLSYLGVDFMQGFLFAKPVDYSELPAEEKTLKAQLQQLHADGMTQSIDADDEGETLLSIASKNLPRLDPGESLELAHEYLRPELINVVPVINKGQCVGLVDKAQLNLHLTPGMGTELESTKEAAIWQKPVATLMVAPGAVMEAQAPISDLLTLLSEQAVSLPVVLVSEDQYKGLLTETDLNHYLLKRLKA